MQMACTCCKHVYLCVCHIKYVTCSTHICDLNMYVCVCACVRACVRVCVSVCACVCGCQVPFTQFWAAWDTPDHSGWSNDILPPIIASMMSPVLEGVVVWVE